MVLSLASKFPLKDVKVSRVVVLSGILTFLYCVEFCIGIRTVYYTFKVWNEERRVSWTLCVASLLTASISAFSVNVLSAIWEQKQLEEREKENSTIRFTLHILVGGMIWRYITLWCIDSKEFQKKGALLLTMTKFFFTQTFTIPMVIVHVSVLEHLEEVIFDACIILCVSVNLILTCTMFAWCSKEVEELKKWEFETVDLVPLIFQPDATVKDGEISKIGDDTISKEVSKQEKKNVCDEKDFEEMLIKFIVLFQSFGFSFGRLLALGVLLKLAGIYAVSIMFLQLLISVIYLKFQAPILVSDSLPKWKQLSRLAFMSYILIFEWHLNRDPKTAYDFSSNMKHSIFYYCIATVESVFYLLTWAVATSYASRSELGVINTQQNRFCRIILIMGSLALVFSLTIHLVLLFWRSRKISKFVYSVRRRYETTKLRLSKYGCGRVKEEKPQETRKRSHIDISSPIPIKRNDDAIKQEGNELEKHNSYRDLREPLDDEIEIYFRKCDNKSKNNSEDEEADDVRQTTVPYGESDISHRSIVVKTVDRLLHREVNNLQSAVSEKFEEAEKSETTVYTETNPSNDDKSKKKVETQSTENSLKSKMTSFSGSISQRWGKFTGSMKGQIQKKREQLQNFRNCPSLDSKTSEISAETESSSKSPIRDGASKSGTQTPNEDEDTTEGYFVGDSRCYEEGSLQSVHSVDGKRIRFSDEVSLNFENEEDDGDTLPPSDLKHKEGDSPCPCYICRTLGDGRFRRRRSSSVPPADRKTKLDEDDNGTNYPLSRYMSSPNIPQNRCEKKIYGLNSRDENVSSPSKLSKSVFNLSVLSLENRLEHYV